MSYTIAGGATFNLAFGSQIPYPVDNSNMAYCNVVEGALLLLPMVEMRIKDVTGFFTSTVTLDDGTPLFVSMGQIDSSGAPKTQRFRVFGKPKVEPGAGADVYKIVGILDAPDYFREQAAESFFGTSDDAIGQIASACALTFNYMSRARPNDKQQWQAFKKSYGWLARNVAAHGYVDDQSAMAVGVTADRELRYVNLAEQARGTPQTLLYYNALENVPANVQATTNGNQHQVIYHSHKNMGGLLNNVGGYLSGNGQEQLDGTYDRVGKIQFVKMTSDVNVNEDVYGNVKTVRQAYAPPDCGNTHDNYMAARNQNVRGRALYSSQVAPVTVSTTGLDLFDLVYLDVVRKGETTDNAALSGKYVVGAKLRTVRGMMAYEKLSLLNTGPNYDPLNEDV